MMAEYFGSYCLHIILQSIIIDIELCDTKILEYIFGCVFSYNFTIDIDFQNFMLRKC